MKRDLRLPIAILLFAGTAIALLIQAWIVAAYVDAAITGNWTNFADTFSVEAPASGPNEFCLDYCAADLPFLAGWIGVGGFVLGWLILVYVWWKPKS